MSSGKSLVYDRSDRYHQSQVPDDQRTRFQRDRDRLLYSSAFRRLAGVTQVVAAGEGDVFHNRLTHTLKVAQIARRLSEKLCSEQCAKAKAQGGLDPEVVEAAALAHDLGHPPFGHVAEKKLNELVSENGYEGNAQSFRIITKLSFSRPNFHGLNLTRATLNAVLKYPWLQEGAGPKNRKFGAFHSEEDEFRFARASSLQGHKSLEAELMDWADDIAYSVHDMEDFYEAGLIPLKLLQADKDEQMRFLDRTQQRWEEDRRPEAQNFLGYRDAFSKIIEFVPVSDPSSDRGRDKLRPFTSHVVSEYINAIEISDPDQDNGKTVSIDQNKKKEVEILKELTWHYVIRSPSLATQQHGYEQIVERLFQIYAEVLRGGKYELVPDWFSVEFRDFSKNAEVERAAADIVSSLSDSQALAHFRRLTGVAPGSILDLV